MAKLQKNSNSMMTKLLFRLLPVQILLALIGSVNGFISSIFAGNFIGETAMNAVGLYAPINQLLSSITGMLLTGSTILCGKHMGENEIKKMRGVFSLDMILTTCISIVAIMVIVIMAVFNLTGLMTGDGEAREILNIYMLGQAIGVFPLLMGGQLSSFLSLENKVQRTTIASIVYIIVNLVFNYLFIQVLQMGAFGLALASSLGMWVFLLIQAQYFLSG